MPKTPFAAALALLSAGAVQAGDIPPGCYQRIYSEDHLAKHPQQVVWQIRLRVDDRIVGTTRAATVEVIAANQGHARRDDNHGRVLSQALLCTTQDAQATCRVECDGGTLRVTRQDGAGLTFATDRLMVGEGGGACAGVMDLAEVPGETVAYRLDRVSSTACGAM